MPSLAGTHLKRAGACPGAAERRRVNVMLNSCTAAIAGMHKEEVLARLAAHDAPISFLPLDFLCGLLHQSLRAAVPSGPAAARTHTDVIHLRMARMGGRRGSDLVRMEVVKLFNAEGQVTQVRLLAKDSKLPFPSCWRNPAPR